jgi:hypothetical protein
LCSRGIGGDGVYDECNVYHWLPANSRMPEHVPMFRQPKRLNNALGLSGASDNVIDNSKEAVRNYRR